MWGDHPLYPYQADDVGAMVESNVLLAYEMGLGKTPTSLAAVEILRQRGEVTGPGVITVPASLKWQWSHEIEKFTDRTPMVIDGTPAMRERQYAEALRSADYLIMTYDSFVSDWDKHQDANAFLIVDEATALKNFKTQRSKHFKKVREHYRVRFALTGTPIENGNPEEIFSLFEWLDPAILGNFWSFEAQFVRRNPIGWIDGYKNLDRFHRKISPYVLRRTHEQPEVAKYLPKVRHLDPIRVPLDTWTRRIYRRIAADILSDLDDMVERMRPNDHPDGEMMGKIQSARMLLDHPDVVRAADGKYAESLVDGPVGRSRRVSPKLNAVTDYVNDFLAVSENKVVIFTSFVKMAHLLQQRWGKRAVVFTGEMDAKARDAAKIYFQTDPDIRIFVSTDAGGYGLDLPQANLLVNYDMPWQAGMLKQRNARIRRASSLWDYVIVQDFVMEGTLEERMLAMLAHKMAVSDAIIDGKGIADDGSLLSDLGSLRAFLNEVRER